MIVRTSIANVASLILLACVAACGTMSNGPAPVADRGATPPESKPAAKSGDINPPYVLKRGGGYYKDDGPGDNPPADMDAIADAVPKVEALNRFANNPYSVLGRDY